MTRPASSQTVLVSVAVATWLVFALGARPVGGQSGVGFRMEVGYHDMGGDWGRALEGAPDGEAALLYGLGGLRLGLAANWASLRVEGADETWHHLTGSALLGYGHTFLPGLRPFTEVRYLWRTTRWEGARFFADGAPPRAIGPFRSEGAGLGARLGVEIAVSRRAALTLFGEHQWFETDPLPPEYGLGPVDGGTSRRLGLGLTWFSDGADEPELGSDGGRGPSSDGPNTGLAIGVGSLGLLLPWTWNEYVRGKPFTPVSPRSWWRAVTNGFAWDDNDFEVNYRKHPYHGQFYYNAARANGYGFVGSAIQTLAGSYLWECCTETHIPSIPDMVTTVAGGIALGESLHHVSSRLLDGSARGSERVAREVAAAVVDPSRGLTRLVTGRAWSTQGGRASADRRGRLPLTVLLGGRATFVSSPTERRFLPALHVTWRQGEPLGPERGLFSYHRLDVGVYPYDRRPMGRLDVRGALWRGDVMEALGGRGRLSALLDMDYVTTDAYRWGAQSLTLMWAGTRPVAAGLHLGAEATASWILMGSVNSEYARFAEIRGVRERLRGYDFGVGPAAGLALSFGREGVSLEGAYRLVALETLNGSNVMGSRSRHVLHIARSSLEGRLTEELGLRLDVELFVQRSIYGHAGFSDAVTRRWETRAWLQWHPDH